MLKIPFKRKLLPKFLLVNVSLVLLSIFLVGFFLITSAERFLRDSVEKRYRQIALLASVQIHDFMDSAIDLVRFTEEISVLSNMQEPQIQTIINKMKRQKEDFFKRVFVIDINGKLLRSTEFSSSLEDFNDSPYYQNAMRGQSYISPVNLDQELPTITFSEPIREFNTVVGVLVTEINLKSLWDLVDNPSFSQGNAGVMIVSENGNLIAHKERPWIYDKLNLRYISAVNDVLLGKTGNDEFTDPNGERMICAYTPVNVSNLQWGVIVYEPVNDALQLARSMKIQVSIFIVIFAAFAVIISIIFTRNLVQPIKSLAHGAQEISSGNLSYRMEIRSQNELGILANEFNRMGASIAQFQKKLQAVERQATMSRFASIVSHEIRNPLNSMVINIEILKREMLKENGSKEKMTKYLNIIHDEIERMNDLVKNYLTLARPADPEIIPENVSALLDELIFSVHQKAIKSDIEIINDYPENVIIPMDRNQIKQVFLNITLNAFQAMEKGGSLEISVDPNPESPLMQPGILISFKDTGTGIPADKKDKIFDYFFSTRSSGTGLGLAIAKQIIEGHNGMISIFSIENAGTEVRIFLPNGTGEIPAEETG